MADIIVTDPSRVDLYIARDCRFDVEFGDSGKNDFELTVSIESGQRAEIGSLVYVDGTEFGGIVDASESDPDDGVIRYTGRSWHGMLAAKVVMPPSNATHRHASGEANLALASLIDMLDLSEVMTVSASDSGITVDYDYPRFCNGYDGAVGMLSSAGARLSMAYDSTIGKVVLSAKEATSQEVDSNMASIKVKRVGRCVNHLICLGEGEGTSRVVKHFYADEDGKVSTSKTFSGVDEITDVYDYSSADADRLAEYGKQRLADLQDVGGYDAQIDNGSRSYSVGDFVMGTDVETGESIMVPVGTIVAVITDNSTSIEYRAGDGTEIADEHE